jgi:hypothetical protein
MVHYVEEVREFKNHLDVEQYRRTIVALNMPHNGMDRGLTANLPGSVKWMMAPNCVPKTGGRKDVAAMRP